MVVYVELVIFNNIAINILILYVVNLLIGCRQVWWRLVIASSIGAAYAVLSPMINLSWEIVLKILLSMLICLVMTDIADIKGYLRYLGIFYVITFLLGGSVLAFSYMSVSIKEAIYSPISVVFGGVAIAAVALLISIKYYVRRRNIKRTHMFIVDVELKHNRNVIKIKGLLDSGNRLYYKGIYPVIAINEGIIKPNKLVAEMKVVTSNGVCKQKLYAIDYCKVNGKRYNSVYAIISATQSECEVILHSSML